jgi:hypothetical protein
VHRAEQKLRPDSTEVADYGSFRDYVFSRQFADDVAEAGYKSVSLDTIGTFLDDYVAAWLVKQNSKNGNGSGGLSMGGWGALAIEFNAFKNRIQELGLDLVGIAHAKEDGDDKKSVSINMAIKGGAQDIVFRSCDMLGMMYQDSGLTKLDFNPTSQHVGKNCAGLPVQTVPKVSAPEYDNFLETVFTATREKMKSRSEAQTNALNAVGEWKSQLQQCKTAEEYTTFAARAGAIENRTVRAQVSALLGAQIQGLFMWDKAEKIFVSVATETPAQPDPEPITPDADAVEADRIDETVSNA